MLINCYNCGLPLDDEGVICSVCGNSMHSFCAKTCKKCGKLLCDVHYEVNEGLCDECLGAKEVPTKIRRSNIELYKKCPYAFLKIVLEGLPTPGNIASNVGTILHDVFEQVSLNKDYNPKAMLESYESEMIKCKLDNPEMFEDYDKAKWTDKAIRNIDNFIEYDTGTETPLATEEAIEFSIGDDLPNVTVIIDRIDKTETGIKISDYKTGILYVGKKLAEDLQVPLYILASKEKYGVLPDSFEFIFTDTGKTRLYTKINDDRYDCVVRKRIYSVSLIECIREIKTIFARIKRKEFSIPRNPSVFYCEHFCEVYKQGQCAGGVDQKWIFGQK